MEQETLFTSAKWNILKALALEKKSPLELAKIANTSMSNISQSLRFLELANIVKSERVSNRDKGQPRVVYSLAKDNAYLIITAEGFVDKKMISINEHKKSLIRIWLHPDENKHEELEKAYMELRKDLSNIKAVFVEQGSEKTLSVVYEENTSQKSEDVKELSVSEVLSSPDKYYVIYDPQKIIARKNKEE